MTETGANEGTLPRLVQSINTGLGWVHQHTRLLEQAMEWDQKSRNNSFLLNGTELEDAERRQRMLLTGVSFALIVSIVRDSWKLFFGGEAYRLICPNLLEAERLGHSDN